MFIRKRRKKIDFYSNEPFRSVKRKSIDFEMWKDDSALKVDREKELVNVEIQEAINWAKIQK